MKVLGILSLILFLSCQSVPEAKKEPEVKKNPSPQVEPSLPSKPVTLDMTTDDLDCEKIEKLTMVACLYPDIEMPFPYCEQKDSYALLGILPFAFCTNDVDIVISHLPYASKKYKPSTIGLMKRAIAKLKNKKPEFTRPLIYTKGLSGKPALEMMTAIYLEHKITGEFTRPMRDVVLEQAAKEPRCLFYQYLQDAVARNFSKSFTLALESKSSCSYYRHYDTDTIKIDIYYVQDLLRKARQ